MWAGAVFLDRFPIRGESLNKLLVRLRTKMTNDRYRKMSRSNRMIHAISSYLSDYNCSVRVLLCSPSNPTTLVNSRSAWIVSLASPTHVSRVYIPEPSETGPLLLLFYIRR